MPINHRRRPIQNEIDDTDESTRQMEETVGCHGNYHSAILLVIIIGSAGVTVTFAPVLISSAHEPHKFFTLVRNITQPLGGIACLVMSAICVGFILKRKIWKASGKVTFLEGSLHGELLSPVSSQQRHNPRSDYTHLIDADDRELLVTQRQWTPTTCNAGRVFKNTHIFQILLFGIGGILYLACDLIRSSASCRSISYWEAVSVFDEIAYLVSMVIQMVFFSLYDGAILQSCALFHYSIALMIADKLWVWITFTLSGIWGILPDHGFNPEAPTNHTSSLENILDMVQPLVEPFFIEFLTISVGVLLHLWGTIGKGAHYRSENEPDDANVDEHICHEPANENCAVLSDDADEPESTRRLLLPTNDQGISTRAGKYKSRLLVIVLILIFIGYLMSDLILHQGPLRCLIMTTLSETTQNYIYVGIQTSLYGSLTILCLFAICNIYRQHRRQSAALTTSDYLLLFATAIYFVWYLFRVIAGITIAKSGPRKEALFHSFCAVCAIVQVWLQTQVILAAHSVRNLGKRNSKLTKVCLLFVAAMNAADWLQMARDREVFKHSYSTITPVMNEAFGLLTTKILIFLLYPVMELYRFHSAIIVYEILI